MIAIIGTIFCLIAIFYLKRKDLFKFSFKKAVRFWFVETICCVLVMYALKLTPIPDQRIYNITDSMTPGMARMIKETSVLEISLAGLEDAIFVLPLLLLPQLRLVRVLGVGVMTYTFMRGHDYQGTHAMLAKAPYVPVAYYFASRYGILTTIIAHAWNDMYALSVIKIRLWWEKRNAKTISR